MFKWLRGKKNDGKVTAFDGNSHLEHGSGTSGEANARALDQRVTAPEGQPSALPLAAPAAPVMGNSMSVLPNIVFENQTVAHSEMGQTASMAPVESVPHVSSDQDMKLLFEEATKRMVDAEVNARLSELRVQSLEANLRAEREGREADVRELTIRLARAEARMDQHSFTGKRSSNSIVVATPEAEPLGPVREPRGSGSLACVVRDSPTLQLPAMQALSSQRDKELSALQAELDSMRAEKDRMEVALKEAQDTKTPDPIRLAEAGEDFERPRGGDVAAGRPPAMQVLKPSSLGSDAAAGSDVAAGDSSPGTRKRRKSTRTNVVLGHEPSELLTVVIDEKATMRSARGRVKTGHARVSFVDHDEKPDRSEAMTRVVSFGAVDKVESDKPSPDQLKRTRERVPTGIMSNFALEWKGSDHDIDRVEEAEEDHDEVPPGPAPAESQQGPAENPSRARVARKKSLTLSGQATQSLFTRPEPEAASSPKSSEASPTAARRSVDSADSAGSAQADFLPAAMAASSKETDPLKRRATLGAATVMAAAAPDLASAATAFSARHRRSVDVSALSGAEAQSRRKSCIPSFTTIEAIHATRQASVENGERAKRRVRKKTQSTFANQEVVEQAVIESGNVLGSGNEVTTDNDDSSDDQDAAEAPSPASRRASEINGRRPSQIAGSRRASAFVMVNVNSANDRLISAEAAEAHQAVMERYGTWQRSLARGSSNPFSEVPTPPGTLRRKDIGEADITLLEEAMPRELEELNLDDMVLAQSFVSYYVEEGVQLWREDNFIGHLVIVGRGTRLSLSRGGRDLRDVDAGQCLGSEALDERRPRWAYTATVRCAGEVWLADPVIFQVLRRALAEYGEPDKAAQALEKSSGFRAALPLQRLVLASHAGVVMCQKEECLFMDGQAGCHYFVLADGCLEVQKDGKVLRQLTAPGQAFGEWALMDPCERRSCTVMATETSTIIALPATVMSIAFGQELHMFFYRSVVRQVFIDAFGRESTGASEPSSNLEVWTQHCVVKSLAPRQEVLHMEGLRGLIVVLQGNLHAAELDSQEPFVVKDFSMIGQEHLIKRPSEWLKTLTAGDMPCHIAILPTEKHKEVFEHCTSFSELLEYRKRVALVREVFIFRHLSGGQCSKLVMSMTKKTMRNGEKVISEGDKGAEFFIIHDGEVSVSKNDKFVLKLSQPGYFGERALLHEEPRAATVTVVSEQATFCVLSKKAFIEVLHTGILDFIAYRNKLLDTDLQFTDLVEEQIIGRGGYGIVKLVSHRSSGTRYALKCVTRQRLSEQDRSLVQRERAVLQIVDHPFAIKLVRSFKDENNVYFLTELVTGGELLGALDHLDVLNQSQAQFYLASLLVVFEYIHEKYIVYRDLKPENVLLDQDGFIKIIDFGASRKLDNHKQKCYTLLGTPQFMAYEMVLGNGYGMSADIWAMGVCFYEFMVGRLPFDGEQAVQIFRQVAAKKPVRVPEFVDPKSADMLHWLLEKNPADRVKPNVKGYQEMREHPFFWGFSFDDLINRSISPPYVPPAEQYSEEGPIFEDEDDKVKEQPLATSGVDDWDADF